MKKKRTAQLRHSVTSTRRISVSAPTRRSLGEGGFSNACILLGLVVFFVGLLFALFAAANPPVSTRERAHNTGQMHHANALPVASADGVYQAWVARYNGPGNGYDRAKAIAVDSSGNVYVTGVTDGSGSPDYATVKYNSAGQQQWVARYNGPDNRDDQANAMAIDPSGNVYVTGVSQTADSSSDWATIKYNLAGQEQRVARHS